MSARRAVHVVYAAGFVQGLSVVAFGAAGNLLRSPSAHGLSSAEYGALFLPFIAGAVLSSSGAGGFTRRHGLRALFLIGLGLNALSMLLMAGTQLVLQRHALDYVCLLLSSGALGFAFGAGLTAMNSYVVRHFPSSSDVALPALHGVMGFGLVLPPLLLPQCERAGAWWLLPLGTAALFVLLVVATTLFVERDAPSVAAAPPPRGRSASLGSLLAAAALYGVCEAMFGDWGPVFLHEERALTVQSAGLALSVFWLAVTGGRILVALAGRVVPSRISFIALPLVVLGGFVALGRVSSGGGAVAAFAVGGLGCSAILPLAISFATARRPDAQESASGRMLAWFMLGQVAGSYGVGRLHDSFGLSLMRLYGGAAVVAAMLATLAFVRRPRVA